MNSIDIWKDRYQYGNESTIEDTFQRVFDALKHIIIPEKHSLCEEVLMNRYFIPGGRVLSSIGTTGKNEVGLNCFVLRVDDNLESIGEMQKRARVIFSMGGGVGFRFFIRPKGFIINRPKGNAAGVNTYIDEYNNTVLGTTQGGFRRGAAIGILDIDHPEVLKFAEAKTYDEDRWKGFNISVAINREFIRSYIDDKDINLQFENVKTEKINARELLYQLSENAWKCGDPGLFHEVNCNRFSTIPDPIISVNPCGEVPLPHYGICCLGSIVLPKFLIVNKHGSAEEHYTFDHVKFRESVRAGVHILNAVLDVTEYPYSEIREKALSQRRIGIGITGLGTTLNLLLMTYGKSSALRFTENLLSDMRNIAYEESIKLAKDTRKAPCLENTITYDYFRHSRFIQTLPKELREGVVKYGAKNIALLSIAPTGTISLLVNDDFPGHISTGIEPIFQKKFIRKDSFGDHQIETWDYKVLGECASTTLDITPDQHIDMMEVSQKYIDNSISKTVNLPRCSRVEDIYNIYQRVVESEYLKGISVFRNGSKGGVLEIDDSLDCEICNL